MIGPVIVCGLGPIGVRVAELARECMGVPALVDLAPDAARSRLGAGWQGQPIIASLDEALTRQPGATLVLTTSSDFQAVVPDLSLAIERGCPVVTTCEEAVWPGLRHPAAAAEVHAQAEQGDVPILAVGINPGFLMDALPAFLSAPYPEPDQIRITRRVDLRRRREPLRRKVGVGLDAQEFDERKRSTGIGHRGLEESMMLMAAALGWQWERISSDVEPVVAQASTIIGNQTYPAGSVIGMRNHGKAYVGDQCRLQLELVMAGNIDDPLDRVELLGRPPRPACWESRGGVPGDEGTARIVLAAIRQVRSLPGGLRTPLDVPGGLRPSWKQ